MPHPPDFCDIYLTDVTTARQGENLLQLFFELLYLVVKLVPCLLCLQRGLIRLRNAYLYDL